jgi:protein-L-isoaspartate(D-aspartate) O-methyltransferase
LVADGDLLAQELARMAERIPQGPPGPRLWLRTAALLLAAGACGSPEPPAREAAAPPAQGQPAPVERSGEREAMVREQVQARGVRDERVLAALRRVPRHRFVPAEQAPYAYQDRPLLIGWDQTISQPYIVAFMTAALELSGDERVLEIGTGSGYQAAILAECAAEVWSIEIVAPLAERAARTLRESGYTRVHLRTGDGYAGWPEAAPFDAIVVTAAPDHVPQPLLDQLVDGGRMILPVGGFDQELLLIERRGDELVRRSVLPVRFVPMTGRAQEGG